MKPGQTTMSATRVINGYLKKGQGTNQQINMLHCLEVTTNVMLNGFCLWDEQDPGLLANLIILLWFYSAAGNTPSFLTLKMYLSGQIHDGKLRVLDNKQQHACVDIFVQIQRKTSSKYARDQRTWQTVHLLAAFPSFSARTPRFFFL